MKLMKEELRPYVEAVYPVAGQRMFNELQKIADSTPEFREFILQQIEEAKAMAEKGIKKK